MKKGQYRVKIRQGLALVRPNALQLEGRVFTFSPWWVIEAEDSSIYVGETAMRPESANWPPGAPSWVASGDLEFVDPVPE